MARLVPWDGTVHDRGSGLRRERLVLAHAATGLVGGLSHDDEVVVADAAGEHYAARVVDLYLGDEDTTYVLVIGVRLPPEVAAERVSAGDREPQAGEVGEVGQVGEVEDAEVLALLDSLRRRRAGPPAGSGQVDG